MGKRTAIPNGENISLAELEIAAKADPKQRGYVRMMAIRGVLLGWTHKQISELYAVTERSLRYWVERFNQRGIDGLITRKRTGRPRKISAEKSVELRALIQKPAKADQSHWTAKKFHGHLQEKLQMEVGYRTVVRWLHEQNFRLKVPQPWPDKQDECKRKEWLESLKTWINDEDIELWYMDEMGVEGDPRPRRRWAQVGEKTRVTKNGDHLRMNAMGMVCPRSGEFFALEFDSCDSDAFQVFLNAANETVNKKRKRAFLVCDNASWHKNKSIDPGGFELKYLPPYSPDLNPIEKLWLIIKAEWFADFIAKGLSDLIERLDLALNWAIARSADNTRTCKIHLTSSV